MIKRSLSIFLLTAGLVGAGDTFVPFTDRAVPQTVTDLWATVDPAAEPLDVEVVEEWKAEGITTRYIRYTVCTHEGAPSKVAALYTFPEGSAKGPAFVWAHGGGQRADRKRGAYFAGRGYATIDINWGGREIIEGIETNTDWGKLDPSQGPRFYPGALRPGVKLNLEPDEHTIDPVVSPRNGNWFLLALAGRRAITFLEQQPEVDPEKIGFTGYSMGGNITSYCAIDPRLKAVAPMVGGTGFKTHDFPGLPGSSNARQHKSPELFAATMDSESYWPLVRCPVLVLNATNDFHGIFERSYRCVDLLPHDNWRASYNLHYSHSLRSEQYAALILWFDRYLKGTGPGLPRTPEATLTRHSDGKPATFQVVPDPARAGDLESIEILYSHDPNPRSRYWRTAKTSSTGKAATVDLPIRPHLPLLAFANCTYRITKPFMAFEDDARPARTITITSTLAAFYPVEIRAGTLRDHATPQPVFHDFVSEGLTGWGTNSRRNGLRTYRFQDPSRVIPAADAVLHVGCERIPGPITMRLRVSRNDWLLNGEKKESYSASRPMETGDAVAAFQTGDFQDGEKNSLPNWENITTLTLEIIDRKTREVRDLTDPGYRGFLRTITWEGE